MESYYSGDPIPIHAQGVNEAIVQDWPIKLASCTHKGLHWGVLRAEKFFFLVELKVTNLSHRLA